MLDVMALTRQNMTVSNAISILTSLTDSMSVMLKKKKTSVGKRTD